MKTYTSKLPLDHLDRIPSGRQSSFYRVETWRDGLHVADFTFKAEAHRFAIEDAREKGTQHDHKVSHVTMQGQ